MSRAFRGASNMVLNATDTPDLSGVSDMGSMFRGTTNLVDNGGAINSWDTSNINDMAYLFD